MTTPDQTASFEADAARQDEAAELKKRLEELEGRDNTPATQEVVEADEVQEPKTCEVGGHEFRFYVPKQAALLAFSLGSSDQRDAEMSLTTLRIFLRNHLTADSWQEFIELMINPESAINEDSMGDIIEAMVEAAQDSAEFNAPKNGPANR